MEWYTVEVCNLLSLTSLFCFVQTGLRRSRDSWRMSNTWAGKYWTCVESLKEQITSEPGSIRRLDSSASRRIQYFVAIDQQNKCHSLQIVFLFAAQEI